MSNISNSFSHFPFLKTTLHCRQYLNRVMFEAIRAPSNMHSEGSSSVMMGVVVGLTAAAGSDLSGRRSSFRVFVTSGNLQHRYNA